MKLAASFRALTLLLAFSSAVSAEPPPEEALDVFELPPGVVVAPPPFDPNRAAGPGNDPGTEIDPSTEPETWQKLAPEEVLLDADAVDTSQPEDHHFAACTPSATTFCGPQHAPAPPASGCAGWNAELSAPLKVYGPARNYFSYRGQPTPLVGASPDNACHLYLNTSPAADSFF